ncbi:MAG: hypothetical protein MUO77_05960 [Anaerolineales bacterium]|nr:hypothetical protein [Anaerolineales bacterium]
MLNQRSSQAMKKTTLVDSAVTTSTVVYNSPAMDSKTLHVLEYHKILERLAAFCDFMQAWMIEVQEESRRCWGNRGWWHGSWLYCLSLLTRAAK